MQNRNSSIPQRGDRTILVLYIVLCFIGWIAIYAAGFSKSNLKFYDLHTEYGKQLLWIGTSFIIALFILLTDSKFFTTFSYIFYFLLLALLVATPVIGKVVHGQRNWIEIGSFQIQPAEFGKLAASFAVAKFLSGLNINMKNRRTRIICIGLFMLPAALVMLTGDTGSALVYLAFFLVMYRFGLEGYWLMLAVYFITLSVLVIVFNYFGTKYYLITALISIGAIAMFFARRKFRLLLLVGFFAASSVAYVFVEDYVFEKVLVPHQKERIHVTLGIPVYEIKNGKKILKKDADYNVRFAKIAIGSGGLWGKGFLQGTVTKGNFVPEQTTDFIYTTVGEEYGFWGASGVIILFLFLLYRILIIAERQRSVFSRVYAYCVACILFFHVLVNIGMTLGLMPVIGIPLPFISYGGSSLWSFTILLFILIKLDSDRQAVLR